MTEKDGVAQGTVESKDVAKVSDQGVWEQASNFIACQLSSLP